MIDLHCHLDLYPDPRAVIAEIERLGMYVLAVTTTPLAWDGNLALVGASSRIRVAPGLHPEVIPDRFAELPLLLNLIHKSRYVGEIGIDGGPKMKEHLPLQESIFRDCLAACSQCDGRVISIHSRGAAKNVLDILDQHPTAGTPVLHWFSGTQAELNRAINRGCWFSVGPGMLRSRKGRTLAGLMPRDRVLTESDGPFVQEHGKSIMPWDIASAERALAECWGVSTFEIAPRMIDNFKRLSGIALTYRTAN